MKNFSDHLRDSVKAIRPYQPGKPIEEVRRELGLDRIIKLASNEYPEGPFPEVLDALEAAFTDIHRYPEGGCHELALAVAEVYDVSTEELFFGNGSNEILELLIQLLIQPGENVVYAHPSFPIYGLICQSHLQCGSPVPTDENYVHDLPAMLKAIDEKTRLVFVCNPNNPTGTYVSEKALVEFLDQVPSDVIVALDEAYHELVTAPDYPDFMELRRKYKNLVSLRSFSKSYSLAGLRIGYLIGDEEVVGYLHRVRQPFNVNRLAQVAATAAIRQQARVRERKTINRRRMDQLEKGLKEMGCRVYPSQTNFFLAEAPVHTTQLFEELLHKGVIVRPMHTFGMPTGSFRVNTGTEEENRIFLEALDQVLASADRI